MVTGRENHLDRNYDPEFCGIYSEEVQFLKTKDDAYLQAVHIVPIRRSVLTMPSMNLIVGSCIKFMITRWQNNWEYFVLQIYVNYGLC